MAIGKEERTMKFETVNRFAIVLGAFIFAQGCRPSSGGSDKAKPTLDLGMQLLISDTNSPVRFDALLKEYQIVYRTWDKGSEKEVTFPLKFSPFTGMPLPSGRESVFVTPSDKDKQMVKNKLRGVHNLMEVEKVLGKPDMITHAGESFAVQYTYTNVAVTLDVIVQQTNTGELSIAYHGKMR